MLGGILGMGEVGSGDGLDKFRGGMPKEVTATGGGCQQV